MARANSAKTVSLTTAQALVKFLSVQFSERDGRQRRLIPGIFGIFGHGNVAGLGQALYEYGQDLPYFQPRNEQSMVHTACGFAKATNRTKAFYIKEALQVHLDDLEDGYLAMQRLNDKNAENITTEELKARLGL